MLGFQLVILSFAVILTSIASQEVAESNPSVEVCNSKKKVLWFMAVQSTRKEIETSYFNFVLAAVNSARIFSPSLSPILIHGGSSSELPTALQRFPNLRLVSHNLTFLPQLTKVLGNTTTLGAWLRFDIPYIVRNILTDLNPKEYDLDYVLYTDTDVLFFSDFNECSLPKPQVLYMGPEHEPGVQANSGVLYMNITAMQQHWPNVLELAVNRNFKFIAVDQGLFIEYFVEKGLSTLLPDRFNWKGYWGEADDIVITHFHGPKPGRCLDCLLRFRIHFMNFCAHSCFPVYLALMHKTPDNGSLYERMQHRFANFTHHTL